MNKCRVAAVSSFALFLLLFMVGCGQETAYLADSTPPVVTATTPVAGATGVAVTSLVTATFSKPMNAATITSGTFTLTAPGNVAVAGTVSYAAAGSIATFTPAVALLPLTTYVATINTGAQDQASPANPLAGNYVWSFTTSAATAAIPPVVTATTPANGAIGVAITSSLTATFSKPMNAATINTTTFKLAGPGGVAVAGAVTYTATGSIATFTPTAALAANTTYIATITTGAQDQATPANSLAANYVWSFTTTTATIPPTVILTNPVNNATGVAPNQVISATFSKAMNAATITTTSFTVQGIAGTNLAGAVTYAAGTNTASFTPTAALATGSTYTATLTTANQDATGNALVANYTWTFRTAAAGAAPTVLSTSPANLATGVPFNQAISATFSVAMNAATINATTFTLSAPGGVAVAGAVTYVASGSVGIFTPAVALLPLTTYVATITTGAQSSTGTALATNYVWTFTTGAAPDTTKPTVIYTIPLNGSGNVPLNQAISATFSEPMNAATITATSFTLTGPGTTPVSGLVSYAAVGNTATFTPTANLAAGTLFTATITTAAADLAGNTLLANYVWTFTTGASTSITSPTIILTSPISAATGVALNQTVSATFSAPMNPLSITTATFLLSTGGVNVPATIVYNPISNIATLTPSAALLGSTTYTATVTTGATDLAGNPLGPGTIPNPWSFTTGASVVTPPVNLGTAALFGGFGGTAGITNQGTQTLINGNLGTTGVSTLITGFHDFTTGCTYTETTLNNGAVNGSIDTAPPPPTVACPSEGTSVTLAAATQASLDANTAYNAMAAFPNGLDVSTCAGCGGGSAAELGNRTLAPGIYKSAPGSYGITLGDLTLDAQGNPNAFWVFQMATSLTVGTPTAHRSVLLINGAQAKNVFWQVGSAATLEAVQGGGTMSGTIISMSGVSISTSGVAAVTTINGRAISLIGPVTVVNTVINTPAP